MPEPFFAPDRETWRAWLHKHHRTAREIWLLLYKKAHVQRTGEACVSYPAAVEEALCFGWIDGTLKRIDDRQHLIRFSPRRPGSIWSASNVARVEKLISQRKMTRAGLALVEAAKKSGQWQQAAIREEVVPPEDLLRALARNKQARVRFEAFAPSHRKGYIHWVLQAKRPETRERRIREVVRRSAEGKRPGIDR